MKMMFLGAPGVGKGTYASRLGPKLGIPHISTGDIFRENVKNNTELGKQVKPILERGGLVPDEMTLKIVEDRLKKDDCKNGFIFDGFPRTIPQAEGLEKIIKMDVVLNIVLPEDILIKKITSRRQCKSCGDIYNLADIRRGSLHMPPMLPKNEGKCDKCGGELYQRKDDNEQTVKERLEEYKMKTQPLIDYYKKKNMLVDLEVVGGPEMMVPRILELLDKYKHKK
ncbi:MAG TPA: adenylate kinase [archaeon]|nr:adenylate kinase [archaeon]